MEKGNWKAALFSVAKNERENESSSSQYYRIREKKSG